ncbi:MAG: hypothetical protein IJK51_06180 [Bacteroidaceae bacterium]|nr:hypothetical protein [Bacteroidaceae bacterium]
MIKELYFIHAENAEGRIVSIDEVPRGLNCRCVCPCCQERVEACKGEIREHYFRHHSVNRGVNTKICYNVTMYKLAEQIIQTYKRIRVPSYYGIFPERDIEFVDVKIDSQYKREDKQPDVIATTNDGKQYLIEFKFQDKVQHKRAIDYENLNCLEVDLSEQSLETIESFLLSTSNERGKWMKWINSENYFCKIEETYRKAGKEVKIVCESECNNCEIFNSCCAVKRNNSIILIENNGKRFRLCKPIELETYKHQSQGAKHIQEEQERIQRNILNPISQKTKEINTSLNTRSCYNCKYNIYWKNKDGLAYCDPCMNFGHPNPIQPSYAMQCDNFSYKEE